MTSRPDGRAPDELREIRITRNFNHTAPGSVLISAGRTSILCTATFTDSVPPWLIGASHGWLTAEYSMLPGSTLHRKARESRIGRTDGRSIEIQRMIGRSLRAVVDVKQLPELSLWLDCDVLAADGGTRTMSVTGAYVAVIDALRSLEKKGRLKSWPMRAQIAGCSVGLVNGQPLLDLSYDEDSRAEIDMNVSFTSEGRFAELQFSGERATLSREQLNGLLDLTEGACRRLFEIQERVLREGT
ncbi:MAG: ribonuclease PH [Planctomycetota bacterium]